MLQPSSGAVIGVQYLERDTMNLMGLFFLSLSLVMCLSTSGCQLQVRQVTAVPFFLLNPPIWDGISRQNDDTYLHGNTALSIL